MTNRVIEQGGLHVFSILTIYDDNIEGRKTGYKTGFAKHIIIITERKLILRVGLQIEFKKLSLESVKNKPLITFQCKIMILTNKKFWSLISGQRIECFSCPHLQRSVCVCVCVRVCLFVCLFVCLLDEFEIAGCIFLTSSFIPHLKIRLNISEFFLPNLKKSYCLFHLLQRS